MTPDFSTSQILGVPTDISFIDTSTDFDTDLSYRRIYLYTSGGTTLVQDGTETAYEEWSIDSNSITLNVLSKDYALYVLVEWWYDGDADPAFTKYYYLGFTLYNETFDYQLTQVLAGNPLVINDNNFFKNKMDLRINIDSGNQAVTFASDLDAAQLCYDRATNLRLNSPYFFNSNS